MNALIATRSVRLVSVDGIAAAHDQRRGELPDLILPVLKGERPHRPERQFLQRVAAAQPVEVTHYILVQAFRKR